MSPIYIDKTTFINHFMLGLWEKMNFEPYSNNEMYEKIRGQFDSSLSKAELSSSFNKNSTPHGHEEFLNGFKQSLIDSNIVLEKTRFENAIKIAIFSDAVLKKVVFRAVITEYKYAVEQLQIEGILS